MDASAVVTETVPTCAVSWRDHVATNEKANINMFCLTSIQSHPLFVASVVADLPVASAKCIERLCGLLENHILHGCPGGGFGA
eukprot:5345062-Amphidinium_carterae.2